MFGQVLNIPQLFVKNKEIILYEKLEHCGPFLWMGFNSLKTTELLQGDSLLSTSKCSVGSGTHLINFDEMKG